MNDTAVYRGIETVMARIMSIETIDGTAKAGWQMQYKNSYEEARIYNPCPLSPEEMLTQDCMTRALLHRILGREEWAALCAKYSINDNEVIESVQWLIPRVVSPAHHLFKSKCVTAWAIPQKRVVEGQKASRRGLPEKFYDITSWDNDGTPDRTLRYWRSVTRRWLEQRINDAFTKARPILEEKGLILPEKITQAA